ncbi:hypothetical protein QYF61_027110 [Mycteria americana]|uniref:Uncharacterized protein n=1 Tax=Mycteria americana TaxID=33587 RepID=A0AAN7NT80_MYCAM|nr:hypothetical protein QYF61_027110 [Mycteria americana]
MPEVRLGQIPPGLDCSLLLQILTESQNHIGWKRPLRSSSPTVNLTLPSPPLNHVPEHLIQTSFKYLQGWRLHHFPGQHVPMLDNPFSEEKFPNIQSKPPLAQLEAISSCPITCYLGEETNPHLSTTSFQVVVESNEVSPQPPFLQAEQPQFPQPLPISLVLQTLPQLRCPSLDTLQPLNVSLGVRGPKLNTGFEVQPHQCRVQGHDHFPSPAGHTISDTSQDASGHLGTLLAHIQLAINQQLEVARLIPSRAKQSRGVVWLATKQGLAAPSRFTAPKFAAEACDREQENAKKPRVLEQIPKLCLQPLSNTDHRMIESFRLKKTFKIIESNHYLTLPSPPLNHVSNYHIYTSFKYLQGW